MRKKDNLPISGYVPDIPTSKDKTFLQTYNRHSDSYSVFELKPEIILISSRISQLLYSLDEVDSDMNWREIILLVELKRKLIETVSKSAEVAFKHQQMERMNDERIKWMGGNKVRMEDLEGIVSEIVNIGQENMSEEKFEIFTRQVAMKLSQVEEK